MGRATEAARARGQRGCRATPRGNGPQPRDINMFSAAQERAQDKLLGRRISEEDPFGLGGYGGIDAITCLNLKSTYESGVLREASRGWKEGRSILEKESSGKPVARSKTMPPQVPLRTYGSRKNLAPGKNRRISVDPALCYTHDELHAVDVEDFLLKICGLEEFLHKICFPVQVNHLPRETLLSVTLFAVPVPPPGSSSDTNKQRRVPEALGWVTTPLFNFRQVLTCGRKLLGLWPATQDNSQARSSAPNFHQPDSVILQIDFPTSAFEVKFTSPPAAEFSPRYEFGSLGEEEQRQLREAMQKKSLYCCPSLAMSPQQGQLPSPSSSLARPRLALTGCAFLPWQDCSYFNSNAVPLKLSFQNVDPLGENIRVIFKCGDDLRQDMLTLQMIRIMNKIWVQEGLDMRMVIFRCFSTGRGRGMVEMIPNAETLRKIQVEHGVTGSFKDRPLADWLQKHNPEEDEYEKAVENFIYSCAGCCVATYVLGICDRHNDNIMLKTTGHMFHIDFGRFLGHAQMFGNIKRDRAPFVFTSDMAYVINGGDKPSSRFHDFVDLCCQAYNLIRKHTHLFLNLLGLMLSCGIPELSDLEDLKYVYDALRPQDSDADATTYFTRLIESSLGSVATKLNFFIHNLAQMKFTGSDARPTLSFAPRTHTLKTSGRIRDVFLCRHERVFNPSKGYTYVVKVQRESPGEVTFVQRTFEEFQELHNKLRLLFPSSLLPRYPRSPLRAEAVPEVEFLRSKRLAFLQRWHLPVPDPDHGYHSLEEEQQHRDVRREAAGHWDQRGGAGQLEQPEDPGRQPVEQEGVRDAEEEEEEEEVLPVGDGEDSDTEQNLPVSTRPACANKLIDYIIGGVFSGEESEGEEDWDDDGDDDDDDGFDSEELPSDSEAGSQDGERLHLWNSFYSLDPYDPQNFTATIQTSSSDPGREMSDVEEEEEEEEEDSWAESSSGSAHSSEEEDEWDCGSVDEAESLKLWNSFCTSDDPYNPLNFTAAFQTAEKKGTPSSVPAEHFTVCRVQLERRSCGLGDLGHRGILSGEKAANSKRKKVTFLEKVTEYYISSEEDRKGPWEEMARDGCRFQKRIQETEEAIGYCFTSEHRQRVFHRLQESSSQRVDPF
ncbi:phosphatidylinositol 4-phosphate 3-kinase C2 domain-containing subunit beta [Manacus vitellinus]|nr:phosphatidylinositol 4-phosphate 3-kinase C2 domain-containing subunit beta [Manacus vitellinus]